MNAIGGDHYSAFIFFDGSSYGYVKIKMFENNVMYNFVPLNLFDMFFMQRWGLQSRQPCLARLSTSIT